METTVPTGGTTQPVSQPTFTSSKAPKMNMKLVIGAIIIIIVIIAVVAAFTLRASGTSSTTSVASIAPTTIQSGQSTTSISQTSNTIYSGVNWKSTTNYPIPVFAQSCAAAASYLYCVGGDTANNSYSPIYTNKTYYAQLSSTTGGIGPWIQSTSYPTVIYGPSCIAYSGYIYCGDGLNQTGNPTAEYYYAPISSSGIGAWKQTTSYPAPSASQSCVTSSSNIYCISITFNINNQSRYSAYSASISSSGIGAWHQTAAPSGNTGLYQFSCSSESDYVYCLAGFNYTKSQENYTQYAQLSSSGIGTWNLGTPAPFLPQSSNTCSANSGYLYCVAVGSNNATFFAPISTSGIGPWKETNPYPLALWYASGTRNYETSLSTCTTYSGYMYCIGGLNGDKGPFSAAYYTALAASAS